MDVDIIIFDLDDTLYPSSSGIWELIRERIDSFMISKLNYTENNVQDSREKFFTQFGTTLRGLESVHHIDSLEFLKYVHNIPIHELLMPNIKLLKMLSSIKLKKAIFTNGDRWHAKRVTDSLNVTDCFDIVIDIIDVSPFCKPMMESFDIAFQKLNVTDPHRVLIIDDSLRNLQAAQELGLQTIWVKESNNHNRSGITQIKRIDELDMVYPTLFHQ